MAPTLLLRRRRRRRLRRRRPSTPATTAGAPHVLLLVLCGLSRLCGRRSRPTRRPRRKVGASSLATSRRTFTLSSVSIRRLSSISGFLLLWLPPDSAVIVFNPFPLLHCHHHLLHHQRRRRSGPCVLSRQAREDWRPPSSAVPTLACCWSCLPSHPPSIRNSTPSVLVPLPLLPLPSMRRRADWRRW